MSDRVIFVDPTPSASIQREARYLLDSWRSCQQAATEFALGGATGRTQIGVYREFLLRAQAEPNCNVGQIPVYFLDEYWSISLYAYYARQHLRVGLIAGFSADRVRVPRGTFYDKQDRLIDSDMLNQILDDTPNEWEARTEPGEDGVPPEVFIKPSASHPVLRAVLESNQRYHDLVSTQGANRLQLLGIGTQGHIGFVECGAARADTQVMLMRLCPATLADNLADFQLSNADGNPVRLPQSRFAISQGIGTMLSAKELLLAAHGPRKHQAIRRMLLDPASPHNPAAFVNQHDQVRVFLDAAAWGDLSADEIRERGYRVELAVR